MGTQSKTFIENTLVKAASFQYQGLYWYIEAKAPGNIYAAAAYPAKYIPVIPVGPDVTVSKGLAIWLKMFIESIAKPNIEFSIALTSEDVLERIYRKWWVWGEPLEFDAICYVCGGVGRVHYSLALDGWLCATCASEYEGSNNAYCL
jgi:hypothetical protein